MTRLRLAVAIALIAAPIAGLAQGNSGLAGKPEDNPGQTRKYLMSLGWGDDFDSASIVEAPFSWGSNTAMIRIVPMRAAHLADWFSALGIGKPGGNGYFVAKIYNLEDKEIGPLGLAKLGTGYLWVGEVAGAAGTRGAAIYSIRNNGSLEVAPKRLGVGGFCAGQHPSSKVELTDGHKCPGPFRPLASSSARSMITFASMHSIAPPPGGGLWVTCLGGCCEVTGLN